MTHVSIEENKAMKKVRPTLDRKEAKVSTMPTLDFSAKDLAESNCVPANCPMFTPSNQNKERPVISR